MGMQSKQGEIHDVFHERATLSRIHGKSEEETKIRSHERGLGGAEGRHERGGAAEEEGREGAALLQAARAGGAGCCRGHPGLRVLRRRLPCGTGPVPNYLAELIAVPSQAQSERIQPVPLKERGLPAQRLAAVSLRPFQQRV